MKIKKQILWITQTALLLGLTVAAQYYLTTVLGGGANPVSQLAVGSLVNLFLILSTLICGFWSGFSVSLLAPLIAVSLGRIPHPWLVPFIILGNIAIVFIFWLICRNNIIKKSFSIKWAAAAILGAIFKFGVLWLGATQIFINFILVNDASLTPAKITAMSSAIQFTFSFPQLATALTGSILAYAIYPILQKTVIERTVNAKN